jgi:tungstate transport system substrate-binding protein
MRFCIKSIPPFLALAMMLLATPTFSADAKCKLLCSNSGPRLAIATGSPGELGLFKELASAFCQKRPLALCWRKAGSGASLRLLKQGAVDVVLVHAPEAEKRAVAQGWASGRTLIGGNRFYLVGPVSDPARVAAATNASEAYSRIAKHGSSFITRADSSGTHKREMSIWRKAGLQPEGAWYISSHDFMMASLRLAARKGAYFMTDSSTWLVGRKLYGLKELSVLFTDDPDLSNAYHALRSAGKGPMAEPATEFIGFLASPLGQGIIENYGREKYGQPLYENATKVEQAH